MQVRAISETHGRGPGNRSNALVMNIPPRGARNASGIPAWQAAMREPPAVGMAQAARVSGPPDVLPSMTCRPSDGDRV